MPGVATALWVIMTVTVIGGAAVLGSRADAWTLVLGFCYVLLVGFVVQATVFAPVGGGIQGRHLLPVFALLPVLAGVVLHERVTAVGFAAGPADGPPGDDAGMAARRRLYGFVGVIAGGVQLFAILVNARRYSVGVDGPIWFLPTAQWAPRFGWVPWLLVAVVAAAGLTVLVYRSGLPESRSVLPDGAPTRSVVPDGAPTRSAGPDQPPSPTSPDVDTAGARGTVAESR